jgi:lysine-N-methylase
MPDNLLQPRYAESFRCIGPECEDSCCRGWGVCVDKRTYKKYRATASLRRLTSQYIELNPQNRDNFKYARIKLNPDNTCPFLDCDKLCRIQKQHGAEFLSKTCSRYPRALARFNGTMQKALHLSCPEAARLVLLSPRLLVSSDAGGYGDFALENSQTLASPQLLSNQLRSFALRVLRDRAYPLWQRLFVLGIVCRRIHELTAAQQMERVPQLIGQYAEMMARGLLRPHLDGIPPRPGLQLNLVLELIRRRLQIEQPEIGFAESLADFLLGIKHSPGTPPQESAIHYHDAYMRYYQPFSQIHPEFLENYLINYVLRTRFPFADTADCVEKSIDPALSHLVMALHYRLLHSLLIGTAARYGDDFCSTQAICIVQHFARAVEHNIGFLAELKSVARAPEFQHTDGQAVLLAN